MNIFNHSVEILRLGPYFISRSDAVAVVGIIDG
jgi:hypothetical protein